MVFVDPAAAAAFKAHAELTGLTIKSRSIKIGWGKHSGPPAANLVQAVQAGVSRNVYIGQIQDFTTYNEAKLREDFKLYGEIEMVNFLHEKSAAFVNFTSIQSAQKAVEGIKTNPAYASFRISHGKDRCANPPQHPGAGPHRPSNSRINSNSSAEADDVVSARIAAAERGAHGKKRSPKAQATQAESQAQPSGKTPATVQEESGAETGSA